MDLAKMGYEGGFCVQYTNVLCRSQHPGVQDTTDQYLTASASVGISPCKLRTKSSCSIASNTG